MKNLENYLELPFENMDASKERICMFFENHDTSLIYMANNGAPFSTLLTPTHTAVTALRSCIGQTSTSIAQQKATTYTADESLELFVNFVKKSEAKIRDTFTKESADYIEFYPNGMKPFNKISKKSIDALMEQQIAAYKNHPTDLPPELLGKLIQISDDYHAARGSQQSKKTQTKDKQQNWDICLETMKDQAFINLLAIAKEYRGKPEKAILFFDTSIVAPAKPKVTAEQGYILSIPELSSKTADISFSPDDTLLISNNGEKTIYCYSSTTADAPEPATLHEIIAGDQLEIPAIDLGAPANKFLIFVNKETIPAEVEIALV
jgi:hypothetical protein